MGGRAEGSEGSLRCLGMRRDSCRDLSLPSGPRPPASKKLSVFMRVCDVAQLVIESPKPPNCHPEREGGGSGGREGSPHKSWCGSTVIAEILRSPRAHHPSLRTTQNLQVFLLSSSALAL